MKWLSKLNPIRLVFDFIGDWLFALWSALYTPKTDDETDDAVNYFRDLKAEEVMEKVKGQTEEFPGNNETKSGE